MKLKELAEIVLSFRSKKKRKHLINSCNILKYLFGDYLAGIRKRKEYIFFYKH